MVIYIQVQNVMIYMKYRQIQYFNAFQGISKSTSIKNLLRFCLGKTMFFFKFLLLKPSLFQNISWELLIKKLLIKFEYLYFWWCSKWLKLSFPPTTDIIYINIRFKNIVEKYSRYFHIVLNISIIMLKLEHSGYIEKKYFTVSINVCCCFPN